MIKYLTKNVNSKVLSIWGLDGASKSTSITTIKKEFENFHIPTEVVRKPGGTPFSEALRGIHKQKWDEPVHTFTELMLMGASFKQSTLNRTLPLLQEGKTIIEDRGWGCTYAYQIHERELDMVLFSQVINQSLEGAKPRFILFLDVDPEIGLERARGRGVLDRLELESIENIYRRQRGYRALAEYFPENIITIDANRDIKRVQDDVKDWAHFAAKESLFNP